MICHFTPRSFIERRTLPAPNSCYSEFIVTLLLLASELHPNSRMAPAVGPTLHPPFSPFTFVELDFLPPHARPSSIIQQNLTHPPYRISGTPCARSYLLTALILFSICR